MGTNTPFGTYVKSQVDASGATVLVGAGGRIDNLAIGIPKGVDWLSDTISGFDIYKQGYVERPDTFCSADPDKVLTSWNRGTYRHPYVTQAAIQYALSGDMRGRRVGFDRGTILRATGTNGLNLTLHGAASDPVIICPYGDAEALPIITGAAVVTGWTLVDAGTNIWSVDTVANASLVDNVQHGIWQNGLRVRNTAWNTNAVTTLTADGLFTYSSGVLYVRPFGGENPTLGQMEVTVADRAINLLYSDVASSGYIHLVGIDVRKARNSACSIAAAGTTTIASASGIHVAGCRFSGGGVDDTTNLGMDGFILYGPSTSVRLTDSSTRGCYAEDSVNNAFEYAYTDGHVHEFNRDDDHGGNHIEYWASNSNGVIRYNIGENHGTTAFRSLNNYHKGGVWITNYTTTPSDGDQTVSIGNTVEFNYFHNMTGQGIDVFGGTGNKIRHNTLFNDEAVATNRLINFATNSPVVGTVSAEISNNLCISSSPGTSRFAIDVMQGTANNAGGFSITSTLTGDNNYYSCGSITTAAKVRVNGANPASLAAWKAAVTPFGTADVWDVLGTIDGGTYVQTDGSPSTTFPGIGTGKTSLTGIGNRYLHGEAYNPAAPTIGAMV